MDQIERTIYKLFRTYIEEGLLTVDFISSKQEYYSGARCHSRILGILIKAFHSLGYIVDVERKVKFHIPFKQNGKSRNMNVFQPDITVVNKNDKIVGIVEYETIDAPEEHLYKKIEYFKNAIPANPTLEFIVYMPTLTTLQTKPNAWIIKDRMKFNEPITEKLKDVSKFNSNINFHYLILNEEGLSAKTINNGVVIGESSEKIWIN